MEAIPDIHTTIVAIAGFIAAVAYLVASTAKLLAALGFKKIAQEKEFFASLKM
jgi:hypothetical protein